MSARRPSAPSPPDPPPIGKGVEAFDNLFRRDDDPPSTPSSPSSPSGPPHPPISPTSPGNSDILRRLTWAAVVIHGGQRSGKFTGDSFARAVREMFELREAPEAKWCRDVLRKVEHVTVYPGGALFKVQTG